MLEHQTQTQQDGERSKASSDVLERVDRTLVERLGWIHLLLSSSRGPIVLTSEEDP